MAKRLIISTPRPNDQGGIIPNGVIDFERYNKNPVFLKEHWWGGDPIGRLTDIKLTNGKWTAIPVFHCETKESTEAKAMYEAGALQAASIGGEAIWRKNPVTDEYVRDQNGYKQCEKFFLYEVSLVSLPSNADCVTEEIAELHAKFYDDTGNYETMESKMLALSSKFNYANMPKPNEANGQEQAKPEGTQAAATTERTTAGAVQTDVNELPPVIKKAIAEGMTVTFSAPTTIVKNGTPPAQNGQPESTVPAKTIIEDAEHPGTIGMAAKAFKMAEKALKRAQLKAEECVEKAKKAKEDADGDEADSMKAKTAKDLHTLATEAMTELTTAEKAYFKAKDEADDEEQEDKEKKAAKVAGKETFHAGGGEPYNQRQGNSNSNGNSQQDSRGHKPVQKTRAELEATLTLAAAPSMRAQVKREAEGVTFTRLNSSKATEDDTKLLKRVFNANRSTTDSVSVKDHAIVLSSIMNDTRLRPIVERTRLMANVDEKQIPGMIANPRGKRGMSLQELSAEINAGRATYWNRSSGLMENITMLTTTDAALASPALNTIEWLSLAIFELFPTTSWKASIPMFATEVSTKNTGAIWANILAQPAVYKGNSPAPAADYTYTDGAVSVALTPYYLQPTLWNPLTMHQYRYDQMSTGWAQSFAYWNTVIDDNLIYTLASLIPAASIVPSSGLSGYQAAAQAFNIPGSGPQNKFYWSPNYAGNLLYPTLNDIIALEQVFRNQNFELEREKAMLVIDPIMERYFAQDPEAKSMLTSWVSRDSEQFLGYKHTMLDVRSRVAAYDQATGLVKDINGAIPVTTVSAGMSFLPSQVGMALGMLDVFMIQDPTNYGYRMSADIRVGVNWLRSNFYGGALYVYGNANV